MDQGSDPSLEPSETNVFLIWMIVVIIIGLVVGGGYWYYEKMIVHRSSVKPAPSPEISIPLWKEHSEKTMTNFFTYYLASGTNSEGQVKAKKARDLLTIAVQGQLEAFKDSSGNIITDVSLQLDKFIGLESKANKFEIISTREINNSQVEAKIRFEFTEIIDKTFTLKYQDNLWLIDSVVDTVVVVSPSPSAIISPSISPSVSPATSL